VAKVREPQRAAGGLQLRYRVGQFWRGLWARVAPQEQAVAAQFLTPAASALFRAMPRDAQRHSLNVLYGVQAAGYDQPDLAAAALLHDVGKDAARAGGVKLGLWLRGPLVLLDHFAPHLTVRWASDDPDQSWRYLLYVQREHPLIGAAWAARAGCSELCCWLIAHHQTPPATLNAPGEWREWLAALQAVDDRN
jgi:hypothetical protein